MTQEQRIKKEKNRIKKIFANMDKDKLRVLEGLIERAAFMRVSLEDMEADLKENGFTEEFQQSKGVPPYERQRPIANQYNTMNSGYQKIIKQLSDLIPESDKATDEFMEFVATRK